MSRSAKRARGISRAGHITMSSTTPAPLAVSVPDAARMVGIGRSRFYELLREKSGPATLMLGGRRLVRVDALRDWLMKLEEVA